MPFLWCCKVSIVDPAPFPAQEPDLRYLVENIWGGQSILSAATDVHDLTLARWNPAHQWSPWNCVMMTKDEARGHNALESVEEVRCFGPTCTVPAQIYIHVPVC